MFWKNFIDLCAKNDISPNAVAKKLSISSGAVTRWKNGATPNDVTLRKIANYFSVTPEEMLSDVKVSPPGEIPQGLDEKTTEVVMKLSRLSDEQKARLLSYLEYLAFQENQENQ